MFSLLAAADATSIQIEGGPSYMDSDATAAVFGEAVFDAYPIGDSAFSWSPDVSLGFINRRDIARYSGSRYSTNDNVYLAAAGARFHYGEASHWYHHLFFSFQPAVQSGRTQALSTHYEFVSTLGWQWRDLSLQIRHISNGSTGGTNRGETMLLVAFDFAH
ncbi:MAG: lipid A 3-O-deacylase [Rhodanobacter sp.]